VKLVLVLALAGCFGKPGFSGKDAAVTGDASHDGAIDTPIDMPACMPSKPSAPGLMVNTASADTRVTFLDGSVVGFRNQLNRYPMPDRLVVAGQNLVATPEGCGYEDQIGVSAFPVYWIGTQSVTTGGITHGLDIDRVGPAYTLLRTQWTMPIDPDCGMPATMGAGNTAWAFFPDGKVVRNDTITPTVSAAITPSPMCNCSGATGSPNFLITSYTTFEAASLAAVTRAGDLEQQMVPSTSVAARGACARGTDGGKVALYWDVPGPAEPPTPPTRLRHDTNPGSSHRIFAFVYDMVTNNDNITTMPAGMNYGIRTHMLLHSGGQPCTALLDAIESFAAVSSVMIGPAGGASAPIAYSPDGVFIDSTSYTGPVSISGALPDGFAVNLRFDGFTAIATDRAAERVVWQRETNGSFTMFFLDGLESATPITVTPECGP
jgi:hypothetical protein